MNSGGMHTIRAAVVGTGFIGPVHVEALRRLPVEVAGILGSTPEKSRAAAEAIGLRAPWRDYIEMLADSKVDAVHIATPNRLHYEMASAALRAGKHVMCDKPLAMNTRESAELVRQARVAGRAAAVCYNIRYYPLCLQAREMARSGALGEIRAIRGSYQQDWLAKLSDFNWRVLAEEGGELRAVADIGTHWLDLLLTITGLKVEAVLADLRTAHPIRFRPAGGARTFVRETVEAPAEPVPITTDDCGSVLLRLSGGAQGNLWVSQVTPGRKNQVWFEVIGSERTLQWNSERPDEMWIGSRDEVNQVALRNPGMMPAAAAAFSDLPAGHAEGYADAFKGLFRDFYRHIAAGDLQAAPGFPTFEDGHDEIALCEAVQKSWRQEKWVRVGKGERP